MTVAFSVTGTKWTITRPEAIENGNSISSRNERTVAEAVGGTAADLLCRNIGMEHRCPDLSVFGVLQQKRGAGDWGSAAVGFGHGHGTGDAGILPPDLDLLSIRRHGENIGRRIDFVAVRGFQLFEIVVAEGDIIERSAFRLRPSSPRQTDSQHCPEAGTVRGKSLSGVLVHLRMVSEPLYISFRSWRETVSHQR